MALLSVTECAARYPVSATHIRRLARSGVVKARRFGKKAWAIDERSLRAYLARVRPPVPPVSIDEIVARYPLSFAQVRRLIRTGLVKARHFGKKAWAVDERSVRAYLAKKRRTRKRA